MSAAAVYGVVGAAWWFVGRFLGGAWLLAGDTAYNANSYLLSFALLAAAVTSAVYAVVGRRVDPWSLTLGALSCWAVLMTASAVYLPGGSYMLTWPLLFGLVGAAFAVAFPRLGRGRLLALATLCAVPGLLLMTPMIYWLGVALGLGRPALMQLAVVLLLGLLVPQLCAAVKSSRWLLPCLAAASGIGLLLYTNLTFKFDKEHPRQDDVIYALDADRGKAVWADTDTWLDEWTSRFFAPAERGSIEGYLPTRYAGYLRREAPAIALEGLRAVLVEDRTVDGVRTARLHVTSARQAPVVTVYVDVTTADLKAAVNGKRVGSDATPTPVDAGHRWWLTYSAVPPGGIDLTFELAPSQPLKVSVADRSYWLPQLPQAPTAYPDDAIPMPYALSDATFVTRTFTF